ncbi:MAG: hypothetical protein R3E66_06125 [bacterium]
MSIHFIIFCVFLATVAVVTWWVLSGRARLPAIQTAADQPIAFGYKVSWLAVQSEDPAEVAATLARVDPRFGKTSFQACNWASGMARIHANFLNREVFVSPPVNGWVFVVNYQPANEDGTVINLLLSELSKSGRAGYFGSHRVVSFAAWALAQDGTFLRHMAEADGNTYVDFGEITEFERADLMTSAQLQDIDMDTVDPEDEDALYDRLPDEADVIAVATAFSMDPTQLNGHSTSGVGLIGRPR